MRRACVCRSLSYRLQAGRIRSRGKLRVWLTRGVSKATEKRELKVFSLDRIYLDYLKVDTHVYVRTSALGLRDAVKGQRDDLFEVVL